MLREKAFFLKAVLAIIMLFSIPASNVLASPSTSCPQGYHQVGSYVDADGNYMGPKCVKDPIDWWKIGCEVYNTCRTVKTIYDILTD